MSDRSHEAEPISRDWLEDIQFTIPFGPLGDGEGIPSSVFETKDGLPPDFDAAEEILTEVNRIFDDTDGLSVTEFDEYMADRFPGLCP